MEELPTGDYIVSKGIPHPISNPPISNPCKYFKSIRLASKDFAKIDLEKFEGCMIDVYNSHFNVDIKILEIDQKVYKV